MTAQPVLTEEDVLFREELRDWLADHLRGDFAAVKGVGGPVDDSMWELRLEWEKELATGRWLNISWPVEYGGRGGTLAQEVVFHLEHSRAEAPYWVGIQGRDLFGPMLLRFGTPEQRARFLPAITSVQEFWGQGFSEPDAGSDLANLATRAERDRDQWVVNGQKVWMTMGAHADWLYTLCRTDPEAAKHKGISLILVPRWQDGVEVRPIRNVTDGREFCEVFFNDARTPLDMVVGDVNQGWAIVMAVLGSERGGMTVLPFRTRFQREFDELTALVRARGLDQDPMVRQRLARSWTGLRIMQLLTDRSISALLAGRPPGPESSLSKLSWSHWHQDFGELAMDLLGPDSLVVGPGYGLEPLQFTFLSSRAETIYGGTAEIQRNVVAERSLGLPREPAPLTPSARQLTHGPSS